MKGSFGRGSGEGNVKVRVTVAPIATNIAIIAIIAIMAIMAIIVIIVIMAIFVLRSDYFILLFPSTYFFFCCFERID